MLFILLLFQITEKVIELNLSFRVLAIKKVFSTKPKDKIGIYSFN